MPPLASAVGVGALALHALETLPGLGWQIGWALVGLLAMLLPQGKRAAIFRYAGLMLIAIAWCAWRAEGALEQRIQPTQEGRDFVVVGYVDEMPLASGHSVRFGFRVERCVITTDLCPADRRLRLAWSRNFAGRALDDDAAVRAPILHPGERWQLNVRLRQPLASFNPGTFDAELRLLEEGVAAIGSVRAVKGVAEPNVFLNDHRWTLQTVFEAMRDRGRQALRQVLSEQRPDAAGVLIALAFGDQSAIGMRDWETFNRTGVGHLMSISGLHITMLAALAGALAKWVLRIRLLASSGLLERVPAKRLQWAVALVFAFGYSGLAGWGIPAQRTCWMLAAMAWAVGAGRSRSIGVVLSLAAAVVTCIDPWAPLAAGFWLSFAAVGAIVLHGSAHQVSIAGQRVGGLNRLRQTLRESATTQVAATLSLLPLGAMFFSSLSLVSPLANAWAVPLVSGLITPALLALAALAQVVPEVATLCSPLLVWPTALMLDLLASLSAWHGAVTVLARPDWPALLLAGVSVAMLLQPDPVPLRAAWVFGLLPLFFQTPPALGPGALRLTAVDVGQGMAALVEVRGQRLLYDSGPAWGDDSDAGARVLVPWLRSRGIDRLDALVISHADIDHSGGAASLIRNMRIDRVLTSIAPGHPVLKGVQGAQPCRRGDTWHWSGVRFEFVHPGEEMPPGAARSPTNARSCVLHIRSEAGSVLLAGDIEARQELDLVARFGDRLRADVLLVPHHGSHTSSSDGFLAAVAPRQAIFQLGYRNRFRHPGPRVLARYQQSGIEILRSDHHGLIEVLLRPGQAPVTRRSRDEDRRYWRVRVGEAEPAPIETNTARSAPIRPRRSRDARGITAQSIPRRWPRPRREPDWPRASRGKRPSRQSARW